MFIFIGFRIIGWSLLSLLAFFQWDLPKNALRVAIDDWLKYWSEAFKFWRSVIDSLFSKNKNKNKRDSADTNSSAKASDVKTSNDVFSANSIDPINSCQQNELSAKDSSNTHRESNDLSHQSNTDLTDSLQEVITMDNGETIDENVSSEKSSAAQLQEALELLNSKNGEQQFYSAIKSEGKYAPLILDSLWEDMSRIVHIPLKGIRGITSLSDLSFTQRVIALLLSPKGFSCFVDKPCDTIAKCIHKAKFNDKTFSNLGDQLSALCEQLSLLSFYPPLNLWKKPDFLKGWINPFLDYVIKQEGHHFPDSNRELRYYTREIIAKLGEHIDSLSPWETQLRQYASKYGNSDFICLINKRSTIIIKLFELKLFEVEYVIDFLREHCELCNPVALKTAEGKVYGPSNLQQYQLLMYFADNSVLNEPAPYPIYRAVVEALLKHWKSALPKDKKVSFEKLKANNFALSTDTQIDFPNLTPEMKVTYFNDIPEAFLARDYEGHALVEKWFSHRNQLGQLFERGIRACEQSDDNDIDTISKELKSLYKTLATLYHPDKAEPKVRDFATFAFKDMGRAIATFKEETQRQWRTTHPSAGDELCDPHLEALKNAYEQSLATIEALERDFEERAAPLPSVEELLEHLAKKKVKKQKKTSTLTAYETYCNGKIKDPESCFDTVTHHSTAEKPKTEDAKPAA